jgi:DNA-directed RNA polymerase subunit RPC12/RpoP
MLEVGILGLTLGLLALGLPVFRVIVAMALMYAILMVGFAVLGAFARPVPEPPPAGELRRVRLSYRCASCGAELRMTLAGDESPQAPRHCADEMELLTTADEL